ncbi:hypothetical protein ACKI1O_49635, partial [Streptomyces scabiei]
ITITDPPNRKLLRFESKRADEHPTKSILIKKIRLGKQINIGLFTFPLYLKSQLYPEYVKTSSACPSERSIPLE